MEEVIRFDQQLLLMLNGSDSVWLDQVMLHITKTATWIPLIAALLILLLKNRPWREVVLFVLSLALVILVCDQFASTLCKPLFHRFRPSHEPALQGLVDLVNDRRGGPYGFISSHAANTFGAFTFIALYLRRIAPRRLILPSKVTILMWACLSSYSRIYLGLHYPGDILAGAAAGLLFGTLIYFLMSFFAAHWQARRPTLITFPFVNGSSANNAFSSPFDAFLLPATFLLTIGVICLF